MNIRMFMAIICLSVSCSLSQMSPEDLTYMTENYPPANFEDSYGLLRGGSITLLRAIWDEMNVEHQPITVYPWARGYNKVLTSDNQVLFSMSRTEDRESLFKWVGPISTFRQVIIGIKKDGQAKTIENIEDLSHYNVGVIRDDVGEETLRNIGYPENKMIFVSQLNEIINLLISDQVDFIFSSDETFRGIISKEDNYQDFYIAYTIEVSENHYAFSKNIPDELIEKIQAALDNISSDHHQILEEWGMELYSESE